MAEHALVGVLNMAMVGIQLVLEDTLAADLAAALLRQQSSGKKGHTAALTSRQEVTVWSDLHCEVPIQVGEPGRF